jgi:hypothetical protein
MSSTIDRPFLDDGLTSRASASLSAGTYEVVWKADLAGEPVDFVLSSVDRVVVEGNRRSGTWFLFDAATGRRLNQASAGASDLLLDRGRSLIYGNDRDGAVSGYALGTGALRWRYLLNDRVRSWRTYLGRRDRYLYVASMSTMIPHALPADEGKVEIHELEASERVDDGYLRSAKRLANKIYKTKNIVAALGETHLVVAVAGRVEVLGTDLKELHVFEGKFLPDQLSVQSGVDEKGGINLIASDDAGLALWRLSKDARLVARTALPAGPALAPPLVDHEGRAIVVFADKLIAIGVTGAVVWEHSFPEVAGAIVTRDNKILVAAGAQLVTLDRTAQVRPVAKVPETLVTPPALTADGHIFVASRDHLFALAAKP